LAYHSACGGTTIIILGFSDIQQPKRQQTMLENKKMYYPTKETMSGLGV
jgi:hypothetical protein